MNNQLEQSLPQCTQFVFLCSGNIIRSAFAHIYAQTLGFDHRILSAGTKYWNNHIFDMTRNKLLELGIDEDTIDNFKPTHLSELDFDQVDHTIFFGMKEEHLNILNMYNIPHSQRFLLTEIIGKTSEIKDPYFEGGFDEVYSLIKQCVDTLYERVKK